MLVHLGCFIHSCSFSLCSAKGVEDDRLEEDVATSRIYTVAVDGQEVVDDPNLAHFRLSCDTINYDVVIG